MELKDASLQDIFLEFSSRFKNLKVEHARANRDMADGSVEVYPYWHTTITFCHTDPEQEVFTVEGGGKSDTGKLADWSKDEDDSDIDVSDRELRHGPPDV